MQVCVLPLDQLAEVLSEASGTPCRMLVIAAAHDGETLTVRVARLSVHIP